MNIDVSTDVNACHVIYPLTHSHMYKMYILITTQCHSPFGLLFAHLKKKTTFVFYPTVCDKQVSPDVLCYNAMLSTLEKAEQWSLALELFSTFSSARRSHGRLLRFFRVLKKDGNRPGHHWNKICRRYSWRSYSCEFGLDLCLIKIYLGWTHGESDGNKTLDRIMQYHVAQVRTSRFELIPLEGSISTLNSLFLWNGDEGSNRFSKTTPTF